VSEVSAVASTWDAHTAAEFGLQDVEATMATMSPAPTVVHVPTAVGATGREAVRTFYAQHFIGCQAGDLKLSLTSRTVTADRLVDEMTISFTHDVEIPWILPGVAPTGRRVVLPIVTVIGMRDGLVDTEHIYWDQASVLVQVGLLKADGLPVTGAEQIAPLSPAPQASAFTVLPATTP